MPKFFTVKPESIKIPENVIAARLGFKGLGNIPKEFREIYDSAYRIVVEIAKPTAVYETYICTVEDEGVIVNDRVIKSKLVLEHLEGSKKVTLIAGTLGDEVDNTIETINNEGNTLLSFFLDGIASELVEFFIRELDRELRKKMGTGSARLSPGYGDFHLSYNKWILEKLKADKNLKITCDPQTYMMKPRKSVTAIIGWKL